MGNAVDFSFPGMFTHGSEVNHLNLILSLMFFIILIIFFIQLSMIPVPLEPCAD